MKKITFTAASLTAAILMISLSACKKEDITPTTKKNKQVAESETEKKPVYSEGIVAHNGFNASGDINTQFYEFWGPSPNSYISGIFPSATTNTSVKGCGASAGIIIYAYKTSTGVQFLDGTTYGSVPIMDAAGNLFTPAIEEIEIHPQTGQVYALVTQGNAKRIYVIDPSTGIYTAVTVNGNANIFNNPLFNGYKSGSIAFVPDGSGGFEFVFSSESTVYASSGIVSWHFSIAGTNLVSITANHRTYAGIPGTTGINTTYGNGKLYFARDGGTNPLYSLSLTGTTTASTFSLELSSFNCSNDFAYWKAF